MTEDKKAQEDVIEDFDMSEDEFDRIKRIEEEWNPQLTEACKTGDVLKLKQAIAEGANIYQWSKPKPGVWNKRAWTPIIWACCNGHRDVVRILIEKGVLKAYLKDQKKRKGEQDDLEFSDNENDNEDEEEKSNYRENGKPVYGRIHTEVLPSPLAWACFKGHLNIVWLLLQAGLTPTDYDLFGNTVMHQAVSGGNAKVFECLLQYGITLDEMNSRKHFIEDLATSPDIQALIKQYINTKKDSYNKKKFEPNEMKFYCAICRKFFQKSSVKKKWIYESHMALKQEKLECRCHTCEKYIILQTDKLKKAIDRKDEIHLRKVIQEIDPKPRKINQFQSWEGDIEPHEDDEYLKVHVDEKLMNDSHIQLEKHRTQNRLKVFIKNLDHISDYKTILKSRNVIDNKLDDAQQRGVRLDRDIKESARMTKDRIIAERNLRFKIDDYEVEGATNQQVDELTKYYNLAKEANVDGSYVGEADTLRSRMDESITVNDIYKEFSAYPIRFDKDSEQQYPRRYVYYDHTGDKKFHNLFRKRQVFDKKQLPKFGVDIGLQKLLQEPPKPKKKKKKKKKLKPGQFDEESIPEEYKVLSYLEDRINQIESLIEKAEELCLSAEYLKDVDIQLQRVKKELSWRKMFEWNNKLFQDALDAKKKKK